MQATNQTTHFDELAGRIEGLGRALLLLAQMMERETDMDGLTLSNQWRQAAPEAAHSPALRTARTTLLELAQGLDDARQYRKAELLADLNHQAPLERLEPAGRKELRALENRLLLLERRLAQPDDSAPARPRKR